ncbi:MAG TPA: isovaleryl-CoA dehydrogenase [Stellaceae bacterium]|nr:isovaleryl-CoA dehydrogenase [Stellaceae bacterium]
MTVRFDTHDVVNQPPPLVDYDLFGGHAALGEAVTREGAGWAVEGLRSWGTWLGRAETFELARQANRHTPVLQAFDRFGRRLDMVEFHPAWHALMAASVGQGVHAAPWSDPRPGAHVARAAACLMQGEVENGTQCPTTMTYGAVPTIAKRADIARDWLPKILSRRYDPAFRPVADKTGALIGMGMTEKQGGSDVRTNATEARAIDPTDGVYRLIGHKWFFSAPMCDAFLVLAQAPAGLSCFFLPRWLPDGTPNQLRLQRLKDKLGNRSNASSEVEFHDATAWLIGEEGRGIPTIIEMANFTRLDCALSSTGLMRQAVAQAVHHAGHRTAFQRRLVDQPLMRNVLADLAIEAEAAVALAMRTARAFDRQDEPAEAAFRRIVTPAVKYWVCKRAPVLIGEAMEVLGGNGYVEDGPIARLYREAPVNSIWEGSGNVMCLDMMRGFGRAADAIDMIAAEWRAAKGGDARLDRFAAALEADLRNPAMDEAVLRRVAERLMLAISGALLVRHAPGAVADAFCASRLDRDWGTAFGTLPASLDLQTIIDRARPIAA